MINKSKAQWFCKDDISQIENYELAIADKTQAWHCHHRRETIYSRNDLIEIGEYYKRPAIELIFLTPDEHKRKLSEAHKGKSPTNKGIKTGKCWWTNGTVSILSSECPEGSVKVRIYKRKSI